MKKVAIVFALLLLPSFVYAACGGSSPSLTAASAGLTDVQDCITAAIDGDTITVPAGTPTWSGTWSNFPDGVKIVGNGTGSTVIGSSSTLVNYINDDGWVEGLEFSNGYVRPTNGSQDWVIKDCKFAASPIESFTISGLNQPETSTGVYHGIDFTTIKIIVDGKHVGEEEWAYADDLGGTDHVVYIEGCTFNGAGSSTGSVGDGNRGGSMVFRFNTVYDGHLQTHGSRGATSRGMRKVEWYRNNLYRSGSANSPYALWIRGGTAMMFDNDCFDVASKCEYQIDTERAYEDWSGLCASGNQFETEPHPGTSDSFMCRDAPGSGQDTSPPSPDLPAAQNDQTYSASYFFNNDYEGGTGKFWAVNSAWNVILEDRDYFLDDSSYAGYGNGGVTIGLHANAPGTCDENDGYWATDMGGNWNSTDEWNGDDGALYVCDASNTWVLYFTPADYPHPLIGGTTPSRSSSRMSGKAISF